MHRDSSDLSLDYRALPNRLKLTEQTTLKLMGLPS